MPPHPALDWRELPVRLVSGHPRGTAGSIAAANDILLFWS